MAVKLELSAEAARPIESFTTGNPLELRKYENWENGEVWIKFN